MGLEAAGKEFNRAIELKPDYEMAHYGLSRLRAITGPDSEAIALSRRATELDPFSPIAALNFCRSYYLARRLADASECFDKLANDNPDFNNGQYTRAFVYLQSGRISDGTRILEDLYAKAKDKRGVAAGLGYAYAIKGNREGAYKMLAELERMSNIPAQEFMLIYLGLRDDDKTFYWLKQATDERFAPTAYLGVDPMYDPIRKDPRFTDIANRHNIPLSRAQ